MSSIKVEKFQILNLIKKLIVNIEKILDNFPKKDIELKHQIRTLSYEILYLLHLANTTTSKDKKLDYQEQLIAKIKCLDFLINLCFEKEIINNKKYVQFGESLENIVKYVLGWIKGNV